MWWVVGAVVGLTGPFTLLAGELTTWRQTGLYRSGDWGSISPIAVGCRIKCHPTPHLRGPRQAQGAALGGGISWPHAPTPASFARGSAGRAGASDHRTRDSGFWTSCVDRRRPQRLRRSGGADPSDQLASARQTSRARPRGRYTYCSYGEDSETGLDVEPHRPDRSSARPADSSASNRFPQHNSHELTPPHKPSVGSP